MTEETPFSLTSTRHIRVLLVDDHAVVRKGIRDFLEAEEDMLVLGEAADGDTAKVLIRRHLPDVVIVDVRMPRSNGIELTRWIRVHYPSIGVLILSAYDDEPFLRAALEAGANGYVLKTARGEEIVNAVRTVAQGQSMLDPAIAEKLLLRLSHRDAPHPVEHLTPREREVLLLAARGMTNRAIARTLGISDRTVQGHLANIYEKLHVSSRTEAVTKALQLGFISLSQTLE